ncbi:MAG: hypothetical protein U0936_01200 [Planctomycetaceae bacterium]
METDATEQGFVKRTSELFQQYSCYFDLSDWVNIFQQCVVFQNRLPIILVGFETLPDHTARIRKQASIDMPLIQRREIGVKFLLEALIGIEMPGFLRTIAWLELLTTTSTYQKAMTNAQAEFPRRPPE